MASREISRLVGLGPIAAGGGGGGGMSPPGAPRIPGFFGDGSDGAVVLPAGNTNLFADTFYTTLRVPAGSILSPLGFAVFATEQIILEGDVDVSGSPASGATGGSGTAAGLNGGDGNVNAAGDPSQAGTMYGGRGGDGGPSGVPFPGGAALGTPALAPRQAVLVDAQFSTIAGVGGGGGAGGGDVGFAGGGGGGGGGRMLLQAPVVIVRSTGRLLALGGNGAPGTGGTAGAGGGGGGGVIWIVATSIVVEPGGTISVVGGIKGAAGAFDGNPGFYIPLTV